MNEANNFFKSLGLEVFEEIKKLIEEEKLNFTNVKFIPEIINSDYPNRFICKVVVQDGNKKTGFFIKKPYTPVEMDASLYAAKREIKYFKFTKTLGPPVILTNEYILEKDLLIEGDGGLLRFVGHNLTKEEAAQFGDQMANHLIIMCEDKKYLYFDLSPAENIIIKYKGKIFIQRVEWGQAIKIENCCEKSLSDCIYNYILNDAYIIRGELMDPRHNCIAWSKYESKLKNVKNNYLRNIYLKILKKVKGALIDPNFKRGGLIIGIDEAKKWKNFFDTSKHKSLLLDDTKNRLQEELIEGENGALKVVKRLQLIDLQRANILPEEVARNMIEDLIDRLQIHKYIKLGIKECIEIVEETIDYYNESFNITLNKQMTQAIINNVAKISKKFLFLNYFQIKFSNILDKYGIENSTREFIENTVMDKLSAKILIKTRFESKQGEIGFLRAWARHINVYGPFPGKEIIAIYRFKPTHSYLPKKEINASIDASNENIGPKILWADAKIGLMLEELITPKKNYSKLNNDEIKNIGFQLGILIYRMFNLDRQESKTKQIHKFDGFERGHFNIRKVDNVLKPCLIDYGETDCLTLSNRRKLLVEHLMNLAKHLHNQFPSQAIDLLAHMENSIKSEANRGTDEYYEEIKYSLIEYKKILASEDISLGSKKRAQRWKEIVEQVDNINTLNNII